MVTDLAHEYRLGILVERILIVAAGTPEMILREVRALASVLERFLTEIRRARQVRPGRVELI